MFMTYFDKLPFGLDVMTHLKFKELKKLTFLFYKIVVNSLSDFLKVIGVGMQICDWDLPSYFHLGDPPGR